MARLDSPRYTILFATAVCVVCALMVSVAAVSLQPRQKANARLYMEKNVLLAAGLVKPGQDVSIGQVEKFFEGDVKARLVDLATGELAPEGKIDARAYDQRSARNEPGTSRAAPANNAGIGRLPKYGVAYFVMKGGEPQQVVISVEGLGMWGTVYGFMAIDRDGQTIRGLTYYDQKETPGLGGEIGNPAWQALWVGRRAYDEKGAPAIRVIKGQAGPADKDPHQVDGMSGATITSNAITRLTLFWLSDDGYGKFLKRFRERGMG
ncbi:MAG: Na(+)-translocating NADH-quinone reductase subunit C [Betaproteobacteria bacterium]|nr:Na(+)-translocating NADH-quinone reductase subunit C [Betaproteobacteria bacterium]PWB66424.1 MAG: Na(+)-translocating NADH-quinone reductase subunit C [Betaproteobacteria bacterium]